ncbi:unnamed protein product [Prunus brigantina]
MGDDSKVMVDAIVSITKAERLSRDYSTLITSDKLDGSNYASWSRGARITITSRRMAGWINGKKPAPSKDSDAFAEWEEDNCLAARKTYTVTQNSSRLFQLRRQSILTCQNGESVKVFYEKLHAIWQEIDCLRPHEYSCADDGARRLKELEADRVYDFLGGLDPPYDGVRSCILALSPVPPPLEAYAMVMEEDTRQSAMLGGGSMALKFSPSAGSRPAGSTPTSLDGPPKCRHCNGNHCSEKCFKEHGYPDWFADYKARMYGPKAVCTMTQDETRPPAPSANLCASDTMPGMGSNTWIIDTGASDHMTYDTNMFDELSRNPRDPYITSANGLPSPVTGEGTIHLTPSLPLSHALLVPNIRCNLLSVGRLLDTLNASATFYSTHCFFQDLKTHAKIGHGKRIGGLYYLQLPAAAVRGCVANKVQGGSVKDKQQLWLWHRRLGHPSFGYLKHLFPSLFRSCDESSFKCETCVMAKSHCIVFPLSNNKDALPFELVHSDNKHDVASILPEFCAMVSTQFHANVKVFRTDNGGEYVNHTLTQFFRDQGIIHQTTTPFTPQQNGVSERKNRQLLEVARSLMLDMSVPHHLWGHGVLAAAYLINRTPSRVLDFQTPLDVLCAHTPPVSVSKLPPKVFGCVAYVHVYSHQRRKLDPCALRCVFIGYSTTQKGYKCYHPPSQKVHVTLDVTFHEEVPYYVSSSSPIQGERGSELKSFGMEDLGCTEASEGIFDDAPTTCRPSRCVMSA